ncbi:MAG: hypothetical protein HYY18_13375, partial [Planctomycetes bacterium]|nr:hypothetical protein [Planctomycetota bacterium]
MMRYPALALATVLLSGCASGLQPCSDSANPFGWPAKLATGTGRALALTEAPFLRELGRLLYALGDFLEAPALAVEGAIRFRGERFEAAGRKFVTGTGGTVGAALNLPFFFVTGRNVDLARDADHVNAALAHIETVPPEKWRASPKDRRAEIFPRGTRVRASGTALVWSIPGEGDVLQVGEESPFFKAVQTLVPGTDYDAQERSWGMIVRDRDVWDSWSPALRAQTIIHEFVHQHAQIRGQFLGCSVVYWPAYGVTFLGKGWYGHWAERTGPLAAEAVDNALRGWDPEAVPAADPTVDELRFAAYDIGALRAGDWIEYGDGARTSRLACVEVAEHAVFIEASGADFMPGHAGAVMLLEIDRASRKVVRAWWGRPGEEGEGGRAEGRKGERAKPLSL